MDRLFRKRMPEILFDKFTADVERIGGWLLVRAALGLRDRADLVEIATDDVKIGRLLRRLGWRPVDYENFMIGMVESSPLAGDMELRKPENWRLRPAMGDNGLR